MSILDIAAPQSAAPTSQGNIFDAAGDGPDVARARVAAAADANPDQAAKSLGMSADLGVPAQIIDNDFQNFSKLHQISAGNGVVNANEFLQTYLNSHPMAARVSKDDLPQLDGTSKSVQQYSTGSLLSRVLISGMSAFKEAFDYPGQTAEFGKYQQWLAQNPLFANYFIRQAAEAGGAAVSLGTSTIAGLMQGVAAGIGEAYKRLGVEKALQSIPEDRFGIYEPQRLTAANLSRDVLAGIQVAMPELAPEAQVGAAIEAFHRQMAPWVAAEKVPPVGVHPLVDEVHKAEVGIDQQNLGEALTQAQASQTRERAPDLFQSFIAQHTDEKLGVSADAIRALYGDKVPQPNDGILGWVPRLQEQLSAAETTGGDVEVPVSAFLTHAEPEVWNALKDHIRFREGGLTAEEAKAGIEVYHGSPYEFEAFDTGKIGTGEGAQSYGYGHYLAEHPDVAGEYAKKLSEDKAGQFYKARILRSPDEFLDWDKPLAEQSPQVQEALKKLAGGEFDPYTLPGGKLAPRIGGAKGIDIVKNWMDVHPKEVSKALHEAGIPGIKYLDQFSRGDVVGNKIDAAGKSGRIKDLQAYIESTESLIKQSPSEEQKARFQAKVDETKAQIEQLETEIAQHEEAAKGGTRNYVVFSDKDIEVTHRNGEAIRALRQANRLPPFEPLADVVARETAGGPGTKASVSMRKVAPKQRPEVTPEQRDKMLMDERNARRVSNPEEDRYTEEGNLLHSLKTVLAHGLSMEDLTKASQWAIKNNRPDIFEHAIYRAETRWGENSEEANQLKRIGEFHGVKRRPVAPKQLELPVEGTTRMEDRQPLAKPNPQEQKYFKLIAKQVDEDRAALQEHLESAERRQTTQAYKARAEELRPEVEDEVKGMPGVALDEMLRGGKIKLSREGLTDDQLSVLPRGYVGVDGVHPDDLAGILGHQSGGDLVGDLVNHLRERKASGLGPKAFYNKLVKDRLAQRVERELGPSAKDRLDEIKDRVLSETTEDLLHEETLRAATEAGQQYPIDKDVVKQAVLRNYRRLAIGDISSDRFLADAGRAGRAVEASLLKGDAAEAFRQRQRRDWAFMMAREARKTEKAMGQFDRTAKRFSAREISSVDQEYTNYIHDILQRVGKPVKRSVQDLAKAIGDKSIVEFAAYKQAHDLREVPVADFLGEPGFRKQFDDLSVEEFEAVHNSIKTLIKNGR
ncbi:MAG: hypothetical protein KGL39_54680, partial [Patescibacteria group bacterium]|nr:hypothetical protein [Patescibacteria group bacterium]